MTDHGARDHAVRVSVVLPFLNAERFLRESVESVLAQTYPDWELVLVDDGSTDGSTAMALDYARRHPERVRYVEHPGHENRGISAARNLGVRHARGEFVAELDADDVWLPGKLAHHVPLLEANPDVGMLYGNSLFWYSWSGDPTDAVRDSLPVMRAQPPSGADARDLLLRQLNGDDASPCPCAVLLRKSVVERVGGSEEAFRGTHEDLALYAKLMLAAPVLVVDGWWDRYRCYSGASTSVSAIAHQDRTLGDTHRRYLEWLAAYLRARGLAAGPEYRVVVDGLRSYRHRRARRLLGVGRRALGRVADALRARATRGAPRVGGARMGDLRRVTPIDRHWGCERGGPIDRHYIEAFLARHSGDVRGRVLEAGDDAYTRRFGGGQVATRDVLHVSGENAAATIVADLADAGHVASDAFDCIILTQTLQFVYDARAAMRTLQRLLAPGGTLLLTVPGISQTTDDDWHDSWYWGFTVASVARLANEAFGAAYVEVTPHGNVLTAVAFLHGLGRPELRPDELAATDRDFPLVITLRARKPHG